ncbi:MAG: type IV pilus modification protein PilV [Hydrogenophaga sp.]|uniref:type IV pilus modification protein PilV n=1 Tax=Hydrogenophaga sp. TaxID=1904254 RepID=UPI00261F39A2|nr:type IV pilus modification protein PilV [Hydrogenophaga sp.]MCV0438666.1 type IV pilus modification protein PilV [Hydrogenophaga sp.]
MNGPMLSRQRGFSMMEVLVSILVFSFGVLALVQLQAASIRLSSDARYRADAAFLADQLFARMLISAEANAADFAHRPGGTACNSVGGDASAPSAAEWLLEVQEVLPGATPDLQQVTVNAATGQVTVTLCWQQGNDVPRQYVVSNQIQWQ